jgi:mono/diheme cytochrome c family protein
MKMKYYGIIGALAIIGTLLLAGCGSGGSDSGTAAQAFPAVTGVAATGAPIAGNVFIKDSSNPSKELTKTLEPDGSFSFDVTGMNGPFILKAEWQEGNVHNQLISFAAGAGTANIHPLSNVEVANAAGANDPAVLYNTINPAMLQTIAANLPSAAAMLMAKLQPMLSEFGVTIDPFTGPFVADHTGLDAMLDAMTVQISNGNVVMINKQNRTTIFIAPITDMGSGTFNQANMPGMTPTPTPTPMPGQAIYTSNCSGCHKLGIFDPNGSPNLSGKASKVSSMLASGHNGISLTTTQISDLKAFIGTY